MIYVLLVFVILAVLIGMKATIFLLVAVVIIAIIIAFLNPAVDKTNIIQDKSKPLENFTVTQSLVNPESRIGILLDEQRKEICLWRYANANVNQRQNIRLYYKDILSIEIIEDDISITKTNRISQVGGALLGGVLLGGVGAVIGGLSGKKETSKSKVKNLELKIIINDTSKPIFTISLLPDKSDGVSTEDVVYKNAKEKAYHWHAVFEAIIKQADAEEQQAEKSNTFENGSVSDELKKLAELKESGILTDDEFLQQKQKVLNR